MTIIRPQEGFQTKFLSSPADIVFGGSGAGVGKTYSLLMEPIRHINTVKGFGGVIFRRTTPQIRNEGGLWDTSNTLYPCLNANPRESVLEWIFKNGNKLKFSHLEYEKDKLNWQGSQIPFIGFDELTHFSKGQFMYMLSRNRSVCGIKPYCRATLNPDPDSWVAEMVEWYIDQETGFPLLDRVGKIRYFVANGSTMIWGDTKDEVYDIARPIIDPLLSHGITPNDFIKSFTFITGSIYENIELMKANPQYLSNLLSQDEDTRLRLLYSNWKHIANDKDLYDYKSFKDMFGSLKSAKNGKKYITADIAMQGADKFVVIVWDGYEAIDIKIIDKSDGKQVLDTIKAFASQYGIVNSHICYDNDGVGAYLGGFIPNGYPFVNNKAPIGSKAYQNLKSQCYFLSSKSVNEGNYTISEKVANTMYDSKMTVKQRLEYERKCIRRGKPDTDNKLCVIPKDDMKSIIGASPDLMDAFMMREYFNLGQRI
jgi:hypothetical protein